MKSREHQFRLTLLEDKIRENIKRGFAPLCDIRNIVKNVMENIDTKEVVDFT